MEKWHRRKTCKSMQFYHFYADNFLTTVGTKEASSEHWDLSLKFTLKKMKRVWKIQWKIATVENTMNFYENEEKDTYFT